MKWGALLLSALLALGATATGCSSPPEIPVPADLAQTSDARLLRAIEEASRYLDQIKRFDMPEFQPRSEYVREMNAKRPTRPLPEAIQLIKVVIGYGEGEFVENPIAVVALVRKTATLRWMQVVLRAACGSAPATSSWR